MPRPPFEIEIEVRDQFVMAWLAYAGDSVNRWSIRKGLRAGLLWFADIFNQQYLFGWRRGTLPRWRVVLDRYSDGYEAWLTTDSELLRWVDQGTRGRVIAAKNAQRLAIQSYDPITSKVGAPLPTGWGQRHGPVSFPYAVWNPGIKARYIVRYALNEQRNDLLTTIQDEIMWDLMAKGKW